MRAKPLTAVSDGAERHTIDVHDASEGAHGCADEMGGGKTKEGGEEEWREQPTFSMVLTAASLLYPASPAMPATAASPPPTSATRHPTTAKGHHTTSRRHVAIRADQRSHSPHTSHDSPFPTQHANAPSRPRPGRSPPAAAPGAGAAGVLSRQPRLVLRTVRGSCCSPTRENRWLHPESSKRRWA